MKTSSLGTVLDVWRSEGPHAVVDRIRDRWQESRRRRGLASLRVSSRGVAFDAAPPPVLNLSPIPLSPKRGGSQIQMLDRLAAERQMRTVALVYPREGRWWLEMWADRRAGIVSLGATPNPAEAVSSAARLVGTDTVHVENLHGLPLDLISDLDNRGLRTVLSIHDFVLFCRRPHLIDSSSGGFCEYSRDEARCSRCLRNDDRGQGLSQSEYRKLGGSALRTVNAVVFPSVFLQQRHREFFPERRSGQREDVIAPATARPQATRSNTKDLPRIGFVGGVYHHKGGALIPEVMARIRELLPTAEGFVYGNGERALLEPLRRDRTLHVRGYYRQGRLQHLLDRDGIAVAILPSIWPEVYAIVVDECLAAGVPVVAFDLGAVGVRLRDWQTGVLAAIESGPSGLADGAAEAMRSRLKAPESFSSRAPNPTSAARQLLGFYDTIVAAEAGAETRPQSS